MSVPLPKNVHFQPSATEFSNFLKAGFATQYMRINVSCSTLVCWFQSLNFQKSLLTSISSVFIFCSAWNMPVSIEKYLKVGCQNGKLNNKSQFKVCNKVWYFLFIECQKRDINEQLATNYENLDNQLLQTNKYNFFLYHRRRKPHKKYPEFNSGDNPVLLTKLLEVCHQNHNQGLS